MVQIRTLSLLLPAAALLVLAGCDSDPGATTPDTGTATDVATNDAGGDQDVTAADSGDAGAPDGAEPEDTGDTAIAEDIAAPTGLLALAPGEVVDLPFADDLSGATLATPLGTEEFLLILTSTRLTGPSDLFDYTVAAGAPPDVAPAAVTGCTLTGEGFETMPEQDAPPEPGDAPAVGEQRDFLVPVGYPAPTIPFEAIAVGTHAVVWADVTAEHPAELDADFVDEFLADFDDLILPRERSVFGAESDLDGDGRIALLFTPLTYQEAVAFFSSCDLQPSFGCPGSNAAEVLYLTPPNTIPPPYNTANAIREILAHELQHLIHYNRSVLKNDLLGSADSAYVLEGFGALAQDVSGYQSGNLYVTKAGLSEVSSFSMADLAIDGQPYDMARDGALRGGAYLFARWLYDRAGGDLAEPDGAIDSLGGPALVQALLGSGGSIVSGLAALTGAEVTDITVDFFTAIALSNRDEVGEAAPVNPCFSYLPTVTDPITEKQRGANLFASFHGQSMTGPAVMSTTKGGGSLRSGGVQILRLAAEGAPETPFVVSVDAEAAPRLRLARVK